MEEMKLFAKDYTGNVIDKLSREVFDNWPETYEDAEKLFKRILGSFGENIEFSRRSKWYVDDLSDMVWALCDRKSNRPVWTLERAKRPECNEKPLFVGIVDESEQKELYTYFICYKHGSSIGNKVIVRANPIKEPADIREIECALVPKDIPLKPTILNIVSLG